MNACSLFVDGASRGNPGDSSVGVIAFASVEVLQKEPIFQSCRYIGVKTNNEAEYLALIVGMELCIEHGISDCSVFMDSQLVIYQMRGVYGVKNRNLKELHTRVKVLEQKIHQVSYAHIGRDQNYMADGLANRALDEYRRGR